MSKAEFFSKLGVYVSKGFLKPEMCKEIRDEMISSESSTSRVYKDGSSTVDTKERSSKEARVSQKTESYIKDLLTNKQIELENHFSTKLTGHQPPQFLIYRPGTYFSAHQDSDPNADDPMEIYERRVTSIIFLNSPQDENCSQDCFSGGSLIFYGLLDDPECNKFGFPLEVEEGLLIAFKPDLYHEVTEVTKNNRFCVVTWFK